MIWYKKLGFHNNPFSIKPAAFYDELTAYDMTYFYKKIQNAEILFVEGDHGSGKTTILKNIIGRFRGLNKIIYYSFTSGKKFDVDALLNGANSFLRRLSNLRVKNIIMLLDEVQLMNTSDANRLLKYYKDGTIQSIVLVGKDYNKLNLPKEFETYLDGNIIETVPLTGKEAIAFVRKRIGNIKILSDKVILKLFALADKNSRRLLEYCEDVLRFAVEMNDDEINDFHLNEVLGYEKVKPVKKKDVKRVSKKSKKVRKPKKKASVKKKSKKKKPAVRKKSKKKSVVRKKASLPKAKRPKKFKRNRLVKEKREKLGVVKEVDEEEIPEYRLYFLNDD